MATKTTTKTASKTTARARATSSKQQNVPHADIDRIISLGGGSHAYVITPDGRTNHVSTSSLEFFALLDDLVSKGYSPRLFAQLRILSERYPGSTWPVVLARMEQTAA